MSKIEFTVRNSSKGHPIVYANWIALAKDPRFFDILKIDHASVILFCAACGVVVSSTHKERGTFHLELDGVFVANTACEHKPRQILLERLQTEFE